MTILFEKLEIFNRDADCNVFHPSPEQSL